MSFYVPTWGMSALRWRGAIQVDNTHHVRMGMGLITFSWRKLLDKFNSAKLLIFPISSGTWCYTSEWHLSVWVPTSLMLAHKRTSMYWGLPKNTIDGIIMNYIHHPSSWWFLPFSYVKSYKWLFIYATRMLYVSVGCCMLCIDVYASYP